MYYPRILTFAHPSELADEVATIESYAEGVERMVGKGSWRIIRISGVAATHAMILKQELLALDGDALVSPEVYLGNRDRGTDALIFASLRQLHELIARFRRLPLPALQRLADELETTLQAYDAMVRDTLIIAGRSFSWGQRTYLMADLSPTAHQFRGNGLSTDHDHTTVMVHQALQAAEAGADLLDVGDILLSSPVASRSIEQMTERLAQFITTLSQETNLPIAIRSYRLETTMAALQAGAHIVIDSHGLRLDDDWHESLAALIAARHIPLILAPGEPQAHGIHQPRLTGSDQTQATPATLHPSAVMHDLFSRLQASITYAATQGIHRSQLLLDPLGGVLHTPSHTPVVLQRLAELRSLGQPILIDVAHMLKDMAPQRLLTEPDHEKQAALMTLAIQRGADIIRLPQIQEHHTRTAHLLDTLVRPESKQ
ncbi:MAG: dihydropteroate synthase [Chloroflexaceae bacterium]|nr:dihydropteroate synthase [Chloroflexaceae bacterium]